MLLLDVPDLVPKGELLSFEGVELGEPVGMLKSNRVISASECIL